MLLPQSLLTAAESELSSWVLLVLHTCNHFAGFKLAAAPVCHPGLDPSPYWRCPPLRIDMYSRSWICLLWHLSISVPLLDVTMATFLRDWPPPR